MTHVLVTFVLACAPANQSQTDAPAQLGVGTQLLFRGSVTRLRDDETSTEPEKTFDLVFLISRWEPSVTEFYWIVNESGRGRWPWIERVGRARLDGQFQLIGDDRPSLLFDRGDGTSVVELPPPLFAPDERLAAGATWTHDKLRYEVGEPSELDGRDVWEIVARDNYGRRRTIWRERAGPLVVGLEARRFMGQGVPYTLQQRLAAIEQLRGERFQRAMAAMDAVLKLRTDLNRPPRTEEPAFADEQIALLRERLPEIERLAAGGPLADLARAARRDFTAQSGRADDVAAMVSRYQGRPVERFKIGGLRGAQLTHDELKDQVTVLHFWEYRDNPLKEPYGQVGYLDFLFEQRKPQGVKVFGVAVDKRLADDESRGASLRSVRKLTSFMNLSYPVLLDGGALLKQFGDPRLVGARLPLFVVVGPDGRIAHYKVGYYDVDRDLGLKDLDREIGKALQGGM